MQGLTPCFMTPCFIEGFAWPIDTGRLMGDPWFLVHGLMREGRCKPVLYSTLAF